MPRRIPLFPLGTVLFPGLVLPLHVFEPRYRTLVRHLTDGSPDRPRVFGVIAIRQGREVGADGVQALYDVGCTAAIRRVDAYDDGRFDLVTVGSERFRLLCLVPPGVAALPVDGAGRLRAQDERTGEPADDTVPYLRGDVAMLPERGPDPVAPGTERALAERVTALFPGYLDALATAQRFAVPMPEVPDDPRTLSYLVAATTVVDLRDRQRLLAATDVAGRLREEVRVLRQETAMLRRLSAMPAIDLARTPTSPN